MAAETRSGSRGGTPSDWGAGPTGGKVFAGSLGSSSCSGLPGRVAAPVCSPSRLCLSERPQAGGFQQLCVHVTGEPANGDFSSSSAQFVCGSFVDAADDTVSRHHFNVCSGSSSGFGGVKEDQTFGRDFGGLEPDVAVPTQAGGTCAALGGTASFGRSQCRREGVSGAVDCERAAPELFGTPVVRTVQGGVSQLRRGNGVGNPGGSQKRARHLAGPAGGNSDGGAPEEDDGFSTSDGADPGKFVGEEGRVVFYSGVLETGGSFPCPRNSPGHGAVDVRPRELGADDWSSPGTCRRGEKVRDHPALYRRTVDGRPPGAGQGAASHVVAALADVGPILLPETELKTRKALKALESGKGTYEVPVPGYERVVGGILSRPPFRAPSCFTSAGQVFGKYAVQTVRPDVVRQYMSGHDDDLAWRLLRDPRELCGWGSVAGRDFADGKSSRLSDRDWEQLLERGVVVECRKSEVRFVAFSFTVPKSDGVSMRLIWSGVEFNCWFTRPPAFCLPSMQQLVDLILGSSGKKIVSADLLSWFVQLPPSSWLRRFFGVRLGSRYGTLAGIPMGWSFAPFIAQKFAEAITKRLTALFRQRGVEVTLVVWNNVLGPVEEDVPEDLVKEVFAQVRTECGCVWKEVECGEFVEVLGVCWDLRDRRWRLKPAWTQKVDRLSEGLDAADVHRWWGIIACIVRAYSVWLRPLASLAPALEWLGVLYNGGLW